VSIESAIKAILSADAEVVALVADRIRPGKLGDNEPSPAVVYEISDEVQNTDLSGADGVVFGAVELECLADDGDYATLITLKEAVISCLHGFSGTIGGTTVRLIELTDSEPFFDQALQKHVKSLEFTVTYEREV